MDEKSTDSDSAMEKVVPLVLLGFVMACPQISFSPVGTPPSYTETSIVPSAQPPLEITPASPTQSTTTPEPSATPSPPPATSSYQTLAADMTTRIVSRPSRTPLLACRVNITQDDVPFF